MDEYTKSQNGPCGNTNLLGLVLDGTVSDRKGKKSPKLQDCVFLAQTASSSLCVCGTAFMLSTSLCIITDI